MLKTEFRHVATGVSTIFPKLFTCVYYILKCVCLYVHVCVMFQCTVHVIWPKPIDLLNLANNYKKKQEMYIILIN